MWVLVITACAAAPANRSDVIDAAIDARPDAITAIDGRPRCAGYETLSGIPDERYKGYLHGVPWVVARNNCDYDGAFLVILDDAREAAAVDAFTPDDPTGPVWVGVTAEAGAWVTVIGGPAPYLPWAPGEPTIGADCAGLGAATALYARPCLDERPYVCECFPQ